MAEDPDEEAADNVDMNFCCNLVKKNWKTNRQVKIDGPKKEVIIQNLRLFFLLPSSTDYLLDPILEPFLRHLIKAVNLNLDEERWYYMEELIFAACEREVKSKELKSLENMIAKSDSAAQQRIVYANVSDLAHQRYDNSIRTLTKSIAKLDISIFTNFLDLSTLKDLDEFYVCKRY
jgi:hypothetical protein